MHFPGKPLSNIDFAEQSRLASIHALIISIALVVYFIYIYIFNPFEVVSLYRDHQLHVVKISHISLI